LAPQADAELSGCDALLTLPAFGEAPRGLPLYRRRRIMRALDPARRACRHPAGRLWQNGLPLGLQIVGSYRNDHRMLRVAKWVKTPRY